MGDGKLFSSPGSAISSDFSNRNRIGNGSFLDEISFGDGGTYNDPAPSSATTADTGTTTTASADTYVPNVDDEKVDKTSSQGFVRKALGLSTPTMGLNSSAGSLL